eukprot:CAMPEP_0174861474 /NCGR_PEP_ID=MMETSP1114-20130205/51718_1 /TAXON_ID=312471 /ORGANISM="Neobodo designis, Strain CCAP 1951/1" /LENGTH=235 /DNA_ID=CAMNT_0016096487 /DNA_START=50 /DNA_END=754 /DNA_ORIENTATION=+
MATTPPAGVPTQHLVTLAFAGPAPAPIERDWAALADEQTAKRSLAAKAAPASTSQSASSGGGLFGVFERARQTVSGAIDGVGAATQAVNNSRDQDDYVAAFPKVSHSSGRLVAAYSCSVMHNGAAIGAALYITTSHLCVHAPSAAIKDVFPFSDVASWLPAVALPTDGGVPFFIPVPNSAVAPDAIELFTVQGHVVQVFNVKPRGVQLPVGGPVSTLRLASDVALHWPHHRPRDA